MHELPKVGREAPDFNLPGVLGEETRTYTLSEYRGRRSVLLFFYVFDWASLCGSELMSLREIGSEFEAAGIQVLGISCDSLHSHRAWAAHLGGLSFPLLSDFWPHGGASGRFGVFQPDGANVRAMFAVGSDGIVRYVYAGPREKARTQEDMRSALRAVIGAG